MGFASLPLAIFKAFILPTLLVVAAYQHVPHLVEYPLSTPQLLLASVAATLGLFWIRMAIHDWKLEREAKKHGAVLPPVVKGRLPGNLDVLYKMATYARTEWPGRLFAELASQYGPTYNMRLLGRDIIQTQDHINVKTILATNFSGFEKGPDFQRAFQSFLGTGVFNSDGERWKFHRNMTRPFFQKERIANFRCFERHSDELLSIMQEGARKRQTVDVFDLFSRFTLDSGTEFLFGRSVDSMRSGGAGTGGRLGFADAFAEVQMVISGRMKTAGTWPLFEMFSDKSAPSMKVISEFVDPILRDGLARKKAREQLASENKADLAEEAEDESLIDHLYRETDDTKIVRDELLNILLAARDTTASLLTWTVHSLSQNPAIHARARAEVLQHIGDASVVPDFDSIKSLRLCKAILNETLRMYPPVPMNVRSSIEATTLPSPLSKRGQPMYIPAGTPVQYTPFIIHRNKDLWGPDADRWDPERWMDERKSIQVKDPFIFQPFNSGPRICLGQQFALNEALFVLSRLLQRFTAFDLDLSAFPQEWLPGTPSSQVGKSHIQVMPHADIILAPRGGMWMKLTEGEKAPA